MWSHTCGLTHSIFVTVPLEVDRLFRVEFGGKCVVRPQRDRGSCEKQAHAITTTVSFIGIESASSAYFPYHS
jgi:hypothetical protein